MLKNIDESIDNVLKLEKENKDQIEKLKHKKDEFKKITLELNTALSDNSSLAAQTDNARTKTLSKKEELMKLPDFSQVDYYSEVFTKKKSTS